jgi:hypothetical protein
VDFVDVEIPGMEGATISASGSIRAIGSFSQTIPEPNTFVLLLGGLAALLAYAWRKRR